MTLQQTTEFFEDLNMAFGTVKTDDKLVSFYYKKIFHALTSEEAKRLYNRITNNFDSLPRGQNLVRFFKLNLGTTDENQSSREAQNSWVVGKERKAWYLFKHYDNRGAEANVEAYKKTGQALYPDPEWRIKYDKELLENLVEFAESQGKKWWDLMDYSTFKTTRTAFLETEKLNVQQPSDQQHDLKPTKNQLDLENFL